MTPKDADAAFERCFLAMVAEIFNLSWRRETARPDRQAYWDPKRPFIGQDDVTALVIHDMFKGEVLARDVVGYGKHFYNRLPDGLVIDLTGGQFPAITQMPRGRPYDRGDLVIGPEARARQTEDRYEILSQDAYDARDELKIRFTLVAPSLLRRPDPP